MQQEKNKTKASFASAREVCHFHCLLPQLTGRSFQRGLFMQGDRQTEGAPHLQSLELHWASFPSWKKQLWHFASGTTKLYSLTNSALVAVASQ